MSDAEYMTQSFRVLISGGTNVLNSYKVCASYPSSICSLKNQTKSFECRCSTTTSDSFGRYVTIRQYTSNPYFALMTICEVQVNGSKVQLMSDG